MSQLVLHAGGRLCEYDELAALPTPAPEGRWHPVSHVRVLDTVTETLQGAGYAIRERRLAIARGGHRFFGTLTLEAPLAPRQAVALAVGIRNSTDKSFPLGFCAGNRVFVCDNLAFRAELLVKRKHTRFGEVRFQNAIAGAVETLASFRESEVNRIAFLMNRRITDDEAMVFMMRAMELGIITPLVLPKILADWRTPRYDYGTGAEPTAWRLFNCFTTVLGSRTVTNPNEYAGQTIRLNALLPQVPEPQTIPQELALRFSCGTEDVTPGLAA